MVPSRPRRTTETGRRHRYRKSTKVSIHHHGPIMATPEVVENQNDTGGLHRRPDGDQRTAGSFVAVAEGAHARGNESDRACHQGQPDPGPRVADALYAHGGGCGP